MSFSLPADIQKKLDSFVPEKEQEAFVRESILKALLAKTPIQKQPSLFEDTEEKCFSLYSDGGARGNPGIAGCGAVLFDERGKELLRLKKFLGVTTNNQAEYMGLILGLGAMVEKYRAKRVVCYADSQLMIKQLTGEYKVKDANIRARFLEAQSLIQNIPSIRFEYVPREKNTIADELANEAMDKKNL